MGRQRARRAWPRPPRPRRRSVRYQTGCTDRTAQRCRQSRCRGSLVWRGECILSPPPGTVRSFANRSEMGTNLTQSQRSANRSWVCRASRGGEPKVVEPRRAPSVEATRRASARPDQWAAGSEISAATGRRASVRSTAGSRTWRSSRRIACGGPPRRSAAASPNSDSGVRPSPWTRRTSIRGC